MPKGYLLLILHAHLALRPPSGARPLPRGTLVLRGGDGNLRPAHQVLRPASRREEGLQADSVGLADACHHDGRPAAAAALRAAFRPADRARRSRAGADEELAGRAFPGPHVPAGLRGNAGHLCQALRHPPGFGPQGARRQRQPGAHHLCGHRTAICRCWPTEPTALCAQVFTAVQEHERIFGKRPRGMWLPECAYSPGVDELLAEAGIRYFVVDAHGHRARRPEAAVRRGGPGVLP